jgi:hypothetical protein
VRLDPPYRFSPTPPPASPWLTIRAAIQYDSTVTRDARRRGAGVADRAGLENRCRGNPTEGSNPSLSADSHTMKRQEAPGAQHPNDSLIPWSLIRVLPRGEGSPVDYALGSLMQRTKLRMSSNSLLRLICYHVVQVDTDGEVTRRF